MGELAIEELNKIKFAEECGLTYVGKNFEGELEFIGEQKAWNNYNKYDN